MTIAIQSQAARHPYLDGRPKRLLIDNQWVEAASGQTFATIDPGTGKVLAHVAEGGAEDIDRAVASSRRAFDGPWRKVKPYERQELLLKLAELVDRHWQELAELDVLDMGAPISFVVPRKRRALGLLRYYAGAATMIHGETTDNSMLGGEFVSYTLKEPVGVVGAIIPWNGPVTSAIWKLATALATGCTTVLKPSEESPLSALRLGELIVEAGFPAGVVNIVTGYGHTAGAALTTHGGVNKISFTGSTATGQKIIQASAGNLKRLTMELGGKSPDIVFADADLDAAVPGAGMGVFGNSGQICMAGTRLFVEKKIYEEFVHRVAEYGRSLKVGYGLDPQTQLGPLVSNTQLQRVSGYLESGVAEGATAISGGSRLTEGAYADGFYVPPTVFTNVDENMRIAREEIFGPVVVAIPFEDMDDLVRRANDTMFGLGSGVWTRDVGKAHSLARSIQAGTVWVNCYGPTDPAVPFGGYKMSGYGRESGRESLDAYLNTKAVWIKTA
ncbi:MAG: aldehyde dehydrogenase family protein [Rhizobiaceae bacterium]